MFETYIIILLVIFIIWHMYSMSTDKHNMDHDKKNMTKDTATSTSAVAISATVAAQNANKVARLAATNIRSSNDLMVAVSLSDTAAMATAIAAAANATATAAVATAAAASATMNAQTKMDTANAAIATANANTATAIAALAASTTASAVSGLTKSKNDADAVAARQLLLNATTTATAANVTSANAAITTFSTKPIVSPVIPITSLSALTSSQAVINANANASALLAANIMISRPLWVLISKMDFAGNNIEILQNSNLANCQSACLDDLDCSGVVFDTKINLCTLKSDMIPSGIEPTFQSYVLKPTNIMGYDFQGNDILSILNSNTDDCTTACSKTAGCVGSVFGFDNNTCYLKSALNSPVSSLKRTMTSL